jgi:tetratricopeptide (TPR) repeat protein
MSNLLSGKSVPMQETVATFLTACGLSLEAQQLWLAAWERVATVDLRRPAGAARVREARPRLLGVHASIQVDPAVTDLPTYVPRDLDADLRTAIAVAAEHGGLVLLVGGSSAGKTRALFEAVRAVLPQWWLLHPVDPEAVRTLAAMPTPHTVVWLDELQRYLDGPGGLPVGVVRDLVGAGTVLAGTLWPHEYSRTVARVPGEPDRHANDRELFGLARVIDVPHAFSTAERRRAEALAADRRIRIALDTPDAGFTQVLAAGPELVRWWENAPDPYGQAVITAALDARRVGATASLSRVFLEAAAPAYVTGHQRASAGADWLDQALGYATTQLRGATAALCLVAAGMGRVAGYTAADYLHQHARRTRRTAPLPDAAWQALVDHHHPDDTLRLADSAHRRMRLVYAEIFYRQAADAGDWDAVRRLADLLVKQARTDEAVTMLRARVDAGDGHAAHPLSDLVAKQGRVDEAIGLLRPGVEAGDEATEIDLVGLLAEHGRIDELRHRADDGDEMAASWVTFLLSRQGRFDEAIIVLRQRVDGGDGDAVGWLADLLIRQGRFDEATTVLRQRVNAGDEYAAGWLAYLPAAQGHADEAITQLSQRLDAGNRHAAGWLFDLLVEQGRVEELRQRSEAGDRHATSGLTRLLVTQGRFDEAIAVQRQRLDAGDERATSWLAELLAKQGRFDEAITVLRQHLEPGDERAAIQLAELLTKHGHTDEAITVLRQHADTGDGSAARRLVTLLAEHGRIDELRAEVHAGTLHAADGLAALTRCEPAVTNEHRIWPNQPSGADRHDAARSTDT